MTDTRERFLRDITARVPADRIAELHLFRPIRRGPTETGIAVIAADLLERTSEVDRANDSPAGDSTATEQPPVASDAESDQDVVSWADAPGVDAPVTADPERHTVFTARYCLTLKGSERGKWEFDVVADADAPLVEIDTVVRGVQRRSGDEDAPERLAGADLRAELDGPPSFRPRDTGTTPASA
jgi:hypothetical protein